MSQQAREGLPSENATIGILTGFAIVGVILVLAFAILAGYLVGKDLQTREKVLPQHTYKR